MDHVRVETLQVGAAVVLAADDAVAFELGEHFLHGNTADADPVGDLLPVESISGTQPSVEQTLHHPGRGHVAVLDPIPLGHVSLAPHPATPGRRRYLVGFRFSWTSRKAR